MHVCGGEERGGEEYTTYIRTHTHFSSSFSPSSFLSRRNPWVLLQTLQELGNVEDIWAIREEEMGGVDDNDTMDHLETVSELVFFADAIAAAFAREPAAYESIKARMDSVLQADCQQLIEYSAVVRAEMAREAAAAAHQ